MRVKMALLKPHATDFKRNHQAHEEDNVFYKLVYRLPESLSCLYTSQKPVRKKKQQKQGTVSSNRFGVILEWEGVVVEDDDPDLEPRVWYVLSLEEAKSFPPDETLKKIEGMRTDQAISEVLSWSKDRQEIERMSLEESIKAVGLQGYFDVIVAAEDFHRGKPEGEMFEVAADQLGLEPDVCLVMGSSNLTTQSAHTAGMRGFANGEVLGEGRQSDMDMEIVIEE
ncbi:hypothetical protein ZWY2020_013707 [Hordeum vulgare]|nr:hypothetical protein ZWY2020_013707 [Hordeum vulgare]